MIAVGSINVGDVSALVAALIAGAVALSINETVAQRREVELKRDQVAREREMERAERERERDRLSNQHLRRSDAYYDILGHVISSFESGGPVKSEFSVRPLVAIWGSEKFAHAYQEWRKEIREFSGKGTVSIPPEQIPVLQDKVAAMCVAARSDLGIDSEGMQTEEIGRIFFDDYDSYRLSASRE